MRRTPRVLAVALPLALLLVGAGTSPPCAAAGSPDAARRQAVASVDSLWLAGDGPAAHALIDSLLPGFRAARDTLAVARLQLRRGSMRAALGDGNAALPALDESLDLARALGDSSIVCDGLRWRAVALGQLGRGLEARAAFTEQLALATAIGDSAGQGWALSGLAYHDGLAGETLQARQRYTRAAAIFRALGHVRGELWVLNGLGMTASDLGEFGVARDSYTRTGAIARQEGFGFLEAMAENNLGTLDFSLGDPGRALAHFERSFALFAAQGAMRERLAIARNIAVCRTELGDLDHAMAMLDSLLADSRAGGYQALEYDILRQRAYVLYSQNRMDEAALGFAPLMDWPADTPVDARIETLVGYCAALEGQGKFAEALALLEANADLDRAGVDLSPRLDYATRRGILLRRLGRPAEALRLLADTAQRADSLGLQSVRSGCLVDAARCAETLDRVDEARGLYLRACEVWEEERSVPLDPEWRERRGETGQAAFTGLASLLLEHEGADSPSFRDAYARLQRYKARTLLEHMRGPGPALPAPPPAVSLERLQGGLLAPTEILLDAYLGEAHSFLLAVTRDSLRVLRLPPRAALEARLDLFDRLVARPPGDDDSRRALLASGGRALAEELLLPLAPLLREHPRVLFAPDGALHGLPLAHLAGFVPGVGEIDGFQVVRVPSAAVLAQLREGGEPGPRPVQRLLALSADGDLEGRPLAGARREASYLAGRYRGVETTLDPSRGALATLADADLLHLALHAEAPPDYAWRASLWLGGAEGPARLSAQTLLAQSFNARLAVLAGCSTAGGRMPVGASAQNIASALLGAGVPAVVASLWALDDAAALAFARAFYPRLERGESVAAALAGARAELAAVAPDPYYWAGLVLVGDGDARLALRRRRLPPRAAGPLAAGAGLLILAFTVAVISRTEGASKG